MSTAQKIREMENKLQNLIQHPVSHTLGQGQISNQPEYGHIGYNAKATPPIEKKAFYGSALGFAPHPVAEITKEDVRIMEEKAAKAKEMEFDQWVAQKFQPNKDPATKAWLREVYPDFYDKQVKVIEDWTDTVKQLNSIKILGPQNVDDLALLWHIYNGDAAGELQTYMKEIPSGIQNIDQKTEALQRGLFNTYWTGTANRADKNYKSRKYGVDPVFPPYGYQPPGP